MRSSRVHIRLVTLKRGLLVFWAVWFSLVCLTNVLGGCQRVELLPTTWQYVSGNFQLIISVVSVYRMPEWLAAVRFQGVQSPTLALAITAFALSLALWAACAVSVDLCLRLVGTYARAFAEHCSRSCQFG